MNLSARLTAAFPAAWPPAVAFDHCKVLLPHFTFADRPDEIARLNRLALDDEPAGALNAGPVRRGVARVLFAFVALRQMWIYFRRYAPYVREHEGVSYPRQLGDLWHCIWHQNRYARHYYWRKLYRLPYRAEWLHNLEHRQLTTLLRHLNRQLPISDATDKYLFHLHCETHGIPTASVLAAWKAGGELYDTPAAPVTSDLFVKPTSDFGSVGTEVIKYDAAANRYTLNNESYEWPDLLLQLGHRALREDRGLILQARLRNAERQACYGDDDVCNLRIVTARAPDGKPEVLGSFIRLPSSFTTKGHTRHVLFASVDCATGRMQQGRFREITRGEFTHHPDTGALIAGRSVPGWDELCALALRAHETLPWLPFIGWDVIDSDRGPLLLEANAFWGGDALQPPDAIPLGDTRFPAIYLAWYDRFYGPNSARPIAA